MLLGIGIYTNVVINLWLHRIAMGMSFVIDWSMDYIV
jgi:hypothetical protein